MDVDVDVLVVEVVELNIVDEEHIIIHTKAVAEVITTTTITGVIEAMIENPLATIKTDKMVMALPTPTNKTEIIILITITTGVVTAGEMRQGQPITTQVLMRMSTDN